MRRMHLLRRQPTTTPVPSRAWTCTRGTRRPCVGRYPRTYPGPWTRNGRYECHSGGPGRTRRWGRFERWRRAAATFYTSRLMQPCRRYRPAPSSTPRSPMPRPGMVLRIYPCLSVDAVATRMTAWCTYARRVGTNERTRFQSRWCLVSCTIDLRCRRGSTRLMGRRLRWPSRRPRRCARSSSARDTPTGSSRGVWIYLADSADRTCWYRRGLEIKMGKARCLWEARRARRGSRRSTRRRSTSPTNASSHSVVTRTADTS